MARRVEARCTATDIEEVALRSADKGTEAIPFTEFQSIISKLRHAFISTPNGNGMLSPCNRVMKGEPEFVFLNRDRFLRTAVEDCREMLRISTLAPTKCRELVAGWPDYVGVKDASGHGIGGVMFGENKSCIPTVFRFEWPDDIKADIITDDNPSGALPTLTWSAPGYSCSG